MPEEHPNAGDIVIWDAEPEGGEPIFWVRTQARGSETPLFDGPDAWIRARAAAEALAAGERPIWLRHRDGRFERLVESGEPPLSVRTCRGGWSLERRITCVLRRSPHW
jgi:hypothetical protein